MPDFDLEKTISSAISRSSEEEGDVHDKKILQAVLSRLIDSSRSGELEDDNIQTLILQVEEAIKED